MKLAYVTHVFKLDDLQILTSKVLTPVFTSSSISNMTALTPTSSSTLKLLAQTPPSSSLFRMQDPTQ